MKVTQGEIEERQVSLRIELDDDDLEPYVQLGYRNVVGKLRVPGFRPGKAPRKVVESMVGRDGLINEALDTLASETIAAAVAEENIEIFGFPRVNNIDFNPLVIDATVSLNPVLDLGDSSAIRVEEEPIEVSDEDVDAEIQKLRLARSTWEPVDRAVELDDLVTINITGTARRSELINQDDAEYLVDVENDPIMPGFSAELVGLKPDEPAEFSLEVPQDFADQDLAGETARFAVLVTGVKRRALPELDDDFAKSVGDQYATLEDLSNEVRRDVEAAVARKDEHEYRELAIEELVINADIEIAPILIEREVERMEARRGDMLERLQISEDDYNRFTGKTAEQIQEEMREEAVERLNRSYAIGAFIEAESIEVDDNEVEDRMEQLAKQGDESTGRRFTNKELRSEQLRSSVRESLLVEEALDRLVRIAKGQDNDDEAAAENDQASEEPATVEAAASSQG